jgi:hypothetical protein
MADFPVFTPQNTGNALFRGAYAGYMANRGQLEADQAQRQNDAQQYVEPAMAGDQTAFAKLATAYPAAGNAVANILNRQSAQKLAQVKAAADFSTRAGMGVLSAPPDQQPQAYAAALAEARALGYDTSSWPQQWGPAAQGFVQYHVNQARPVTEYFKSLDSQPTPLGGPTAGSPATPGKPPTAPGFSNAVASGESGGSYSASNPSGAFGKYQFMPDTWATVASANPQLNLPFNMKQATPQQQEQAFQALTQMNGAGLKAAGIPVSEQSLYLAHRLGVNGATKFLQSPDDTPVASILPASWIQQNPDLQGVTVGQFKQGVLSRFNPAPVGQQVDVAGTPAPTQVAGGPVATPPGTAAPANVNGQGDSAPPGQPATEVQTLRSRLPPGYRLLGVNGQPAYDKAGRVAVMAPDGSRDWLEVPQPTKKDLSQPNPPSGYRWITGADGKPALEAIPGGPAAPGGGTNPDGLTGEQFINTLPSDRAAQVRALYEGRMALSPRLQASAQGKQLMSDLMNAYPNDYDAILSGQRQKTANDFAAGTAAKNITALNTAIQHLGELHDLSGKLDNGSIGVFNTAKNFVAKETGDADITNFNLTKHAVADELSRVFKGTGNSDTEIKAWEDKVNSSMSPAQLQGVLNEAVTLMNGRIEALGDQYNRGMGKSVPAVTLLSPESQATLARIKANPITGAASASPSQQAAGTGPGEAARNSFDMLSQARDAIAKGAPRDAVIQRLRQNGVNPDGL